METIVAERIAFWPMIYVSDMYTRKVISVDLSEIFMPLYTRGVNLFKAFDKNVIFYTFISSLISQLPY